MHDLDLVVRAAGLNGVPLLGNGGSALDPSTPDRWGRCWWWAAGDWGWSPGLLRFTRSPRALLLPNHQPPNQPAPFAAAPQGEQRGAGVAGGAAPGARGHLGAGALDFRGGGRPAVCAGRQRRLQVTRGRGLLLLLGPAALRLRLPACSRLRLRLPLTPAAACRPRPPSTQRRAHQAGLSGQRRRVHHHRRK